MGQYYRQALLQDGEVTIYGGQYAKKGRNDWNHYSNYNGLKLMEHSWLRNPFMINMTQALYNHRGRLVWCGDYADEQGDFKNVHWTEYKKIYNRENDKRDLPILKGKGGKFSYKHKYLVNHTQHCYLDFDLYISKVTDSDGWCVHPLSLLTAIGNGRGGGDYGEEYPDAYMVGRWAGDELEVTDEAPEGYELEDVRFIEDTGYNDDRI